MVDLKIDWCSYEAAKYAVDNWHYSKRMPSGKRATLGVWEDAKFIGSVIFGGGAAPCLGDRYGVNKTEVCELTRVALTGHTTFVTRIISICLNLIHREFPVLKVVVSFADPEQNHLGKVYQAGNWFYLGKSFAQHLETPNGYRVHPKTITSRGRGIVTSLVESGKLIKVPLLKYRYAYPFTKDMRLLLESMKQEYPKKLESVNCAN